MRVLCIDVRQSIYWALGVYVGELRQYKACDHFRPVGWGGGGGVGVFEHPPPIWELRGPPGIDKIGYNSMN